MDSIRQTQDIIDFVEDNEAPAAIIFLDQQKAFDRVEWEYLKLCLERFGFGEKFCRWILMLYKLGESCIQTNGYISRFFKITRSMRQGCPIAAYLYILQSEPLSQTIRKSKHISGISIPSNIEENKFEARISSFADDTQLFHTTEKSILEGFRILDTYCKASGAKLNLSKTKGMYIGCWKNKSPSFKKIKWVNNANGLGVQFGFNINYEEIWM